MAPIVSIQHVPPYPPRSMLLTDSARSRAQALSILATALSTAVAAAAWLGMNDGSWSLAVPVVASAAAALRPTRIVVAVAMIVTAAVVVIGIDGSGVLFGASVVSLMLALNHLQSAATHVRRSTRRSAAPSRS